MGRIIAKLVEGPLDGLLVSVRDDQEEIGGLQFEGYEPMQLTYETVETGDQNSDGSPVTREVATGYADRYVKAPESLRSFVGEEESLAAAAFDHDVNALCEFRYVAAS